MFKIWAKLMDCFTDATRAQSSLAFVNSKATPANKIMANTIVPTGISGHFTQYFCRVKYPAAHFMHIMSA